MHPGGRPPGFHPPGFHLNLGPHGPSRLGRRGLVAATASARRRNTAGGSDHGEGTEGSRGPSPSETAPPRRHKLYRAAWRGWREPRSQGIDQAHRLPSETIGGIIETALLETGRGHRPAARAGGCDGPRSGRATGCSRTRCEASSPDHSIKSSAWRSLRNANNAGRLSGKNRGLCEAEKRGCAVPP